MENIIQIVGFPQKFPLLGSVILICGAGFAVRCRAVNMNHGFEEGSAVNAQNLLSACRCPEYCALLAQFPEHYPSPVLEILSIDHGIASGQSIFISQQ